MNMREEGRGLGRAVAEQVRAGVDKEMRREFKMNHELFPTLGAGFDFAEALLAYDKKRLACTPDYTLFPELRGRADLELGRREGFTEGTGLTPLHAAYQFSMYHFVWKHVNAHHVARYDLIGAPPRECTNVFFPESKEGGVVVGDNRDDVPFPWYRDHIRGYRFRKIGRSEELHWQQGGVSSMVLLDEEPSCLFPASAHELMPRECLGDIKLMVDFMTRYRDFWGPGNQLWIDKQHRGVMVEKANVRVAYRWPGKHGAICITACSYIDPALNAYKRSCLKRVAAHKGEGEAECLDLMYSDGADKRQHRLLALTNAEAGRGATLWGALAVVADRGAPFPDRVCLAGEKSDPLREANANWTLTQHAAVLTGPNRRALYRSLQDLDHPRSICDYKPNLVLGEGVAMREEWQADVAAGRCEPPAEEKPVAA